MNLLKFLSVLLIMIIHVPTYSQTCQPWQASISELDESQVGCEFTFVLTFIDVGLDLPNFPLHSFKIGYDFPGINGGLVASVTDAVFTLGPLVGNGNITFSNTINGFNLDYQLGSPEIQITDLFASQVTITVNLVNPDDCFEVDHGFLQLYNNTGLFCMGTDNSDSVQDGYCGTGTNIGGTVSTYSNALAPCGTSTSNLGVEGVDIIITNNEGLSCSSVTENSGHYECSLCDNGPYAICVTTTCDEPCGLDDVDVNNTSYDLTFMAGIILETEPWLPIYYFMGDINNDGRISGSDHTVLRNVSIAGNADAYDSFGYNWCRFVPTNEISLAVDNSFDPFIPNNPAFDPSTIDNCIIPESIHNLSHVSFTRFMVGDFNGSCSDCIHGDGGDVPIVHLDPSRRSSDVDEISYSLKLDQKISAVAMSFDIPLGTVINSVESDLPDFEYVIKNDRVIFHYFDLIKGGGVLLGDFDDLIKINFTGQVPSLVKDDCFLSAQTGMFAIESLNFSNKGKGHLIQINDFSSFVIYNIAQESEIHLYDLSGKNVLSQNMLLQDGYNQINVNSIASGIYILNVRNYDNNITRKVFIK